MKRLLIVATAMLLFCQNFGCKKKQEEPQPEPQPEDYFCFAANRMEDTTQVRQQVVGRWKLTATLGSYYKSFHVVQPRDTAVYLVVYPDTTAAFYREGQPMVRQPYRLTFASSASTDLGYGGNLWFCDATSMVISGAFYDGPTARYERVR